MESVLFIDGRRSSYGAADLLDFTITVGQLKEILEGFDDKTKVLLKNDAGYTYGEINDATIGTEFVIGDSDVDGMLYRVLDDELDSDEFYTVRGFIEYLTPEKRPHTYKELTSVMEEYGITFMG